MHKNVNAEGLKPGWKVWRFEQLAANVNVRIDNPSESGMEHYVGLEHLDPDSLRIRRWGSPSDVEAGKLMFKAGDIIFAKRRAYQRKLGVAEFDGICSAHAMVLRAKPEAVFPEFLPFFMQSDLFMNRAVEISVGSLSPTINWKTMAAQEFGLPPIEEQRRLASFLAALNGVILAKQQVLLSLEECHTSTRAQFLDEGLNRHFDKVTEKSVAWSREPLGNLVEFLDHKRVPIKEGDRSQRRGQYPYYGASGVIDSIDDYLFDEELILVGEDGANVLDRSSPLAFKVKGKIWVNNHAHVLRVLPPNNIDYLVDYLESISYKPFVTGTAQPKLNKAALSGVLIPVPPGEDQTAIAGVYDQFLESKNAIQRELKSLRNLYRVTLANAGDTNVQ